MTGTPGVVQSSQFNDKNYSDPNPHGDTDDAQRAAYKANQQRQLDEQAGKPAIGMPSMGDMHCGSTSSFAGSANGGTSTSSTSCHN